MSYKRPSKPSHYSFSKHTNVVVPRGAIEFRLLCTIAAAGGVIGQFGGFIKQLERETTAQIRVDKVVSKSCKERLIHVTGSSTVNRKVRFSVEEVAVSAAQEALVRVFDRMVEVDPPEVEDGTVSCWLLVGPGLVGAVIGSGGKKIDKISKETGGTITIFGPLDALPRCAHSSDEMIQISGGSLAVKNALLAVSRCIQQKTHFMEGTNGASVVLHPSMKMETGDAVVDDRVNEIAATEGGFQTTLFAGHSWCCDRLQREKSESS